MLARTHYQEPQHELHSPICQFDVQKSFTLRILSDLNGAFHLVVLVHSNGLIRVQHRLQ